MLNNFWFVPALPQISRILLYDIVSSHVGYRRSHSMRKVYKNLCPATISASIMAANMWENGLKNVESDNNKILYETLLDFYYSETVLTFWISLVRTLQQRSQTKSTHLNLCISHSASTLGPMKLAMDLTPCNKDPLPLQPQYILPACYSLWCDIALHGIYHWIHKALVIFPQSNQHASMRLHTCPQQAQILTIPHNNRHFHYTHGPVYWNGAQQVDSLCCLYIPL